MRLERVLSNLADTDRVAAALVAMLRPGDAIALSGDLGSGKTTFVRALATAMGIDPSLVSSPTYVIANQYPGPHGRRMAHVDAYRLHGPEDLDAIGWDLLTDGTWILAIEWPDRIGGIGGGAIDRDALDMHMEHAPTRNGIEARHLTLGIPDTWLDRPELPALVRACRGVARCPVTGEPVAPDSPSYPFSSERARMADLNKWLSGGHTISRPLADEDIGAG